MTRETLCDLFDAQRSRQDAQKPAHMNEKMGQVESPRQRSRCRIQAGAFREKSKSGIRVEPDRERRSEGKCESGRVLWEDTVIA